MAYSEKWPTPGITANASVHLSRRFCNYSILLATDVLYGRMRLQDRCCWEPCACPCLLLRHDSCSILLSACFKKLKLNQCACGRSRIVYHLEQVPVRMWGQWQSSVKCGIYHQQAAERVEYEYSTIQRAGSPRLGGEPYWYISHGKLARQALRKCKRYYKSQK